MEAFLRRVRGAPSIEDERESLRHAREVAAAQLEAMKRELADRVHAVRERERELAAALARAGGAPAAAPQLEQPARVEPLVPEPASEAVVDYRRIEKRLADLRAAEKLFLDTQAELAERSEAITARERVVARRERVLGDGEHSALAEPEAHPRRPEKADEARPGVGPASFADGLESLRRRGTRRRT